MTITICDTFKTFCFGIRGTLLPACWGAFRAIGRFYDLGQEGDSFLNVLAPMETWGHGFFKHPDRATLRFRCFSSEPLSGATCQFESCTGVDLVEDIQFRPAISIFPTFISPMQLLPIHAVLGKCSCVPLYHYSHAWRCPKRMIRRVTICCSSLTQQASLAGLLPGAT